MGWIRGFRIECVVCRRFIDEDVIGVEMRKMIGCNEREIIIRIARV